MRVHSRTWRGVAAATSAVLFASVIPGWAATAAQATVAPADHCVVDAPPPTAEANVAPAATPTASYTAAWNAIGAVKDGRTVFTGGANTDVWGTYAGSNRPAQQWLQLEWSEPRRLSSASMSFWSDASDNAGDGVAIPRSWKLQSWSGTAWVDVPLPSGGAYPRDAAAPNVITFAAPVETTRLRATFDAATNGTSFAAVAVSEFEARGAQASTDGVEWLASDAFNVGISRKTGGIYHLANAADGPTCTNYVSNPTLRPEFDIDDSRWLGDIVLRANGTPRVSGLSDDIRTVSKNGDAVNVSYRGDAARNNGFRGMGIDETYALTGTQKDVLDWKIRVKNTAATPLKLEDLGIPMLMNSWWDGGNQTGIYEQNVARHSFVADDGSYMFWQRPNGEGPYLVMVPQDGTHLEFKDKARPGEGPFQEKDPSWEGLVEYYIHSEHIAPVRAGSQNAAAFLPASSATIAPGADKTYGFTFRWADDYADMRDVLFDAGVVDVVSLPGMVIPQDTHATLAVRAKDGIDGVVGGGGKTAAGSDTVITRTGEKNGYQLYDLSFPTRGENYVTVNYGGGKSSVLQYYSIEPVDKLIDANSRFIVDNQQAKNPAKGYDGAYLQWDMRTKQLVTRDNFSQVAVGGIGEFQLRWMTGGSDDIGLSPAAFVAEKNAVSEPDAAQVASLDYYIDNFLLGYLQNQFRDGQRTWNLYHWYDGGDGDRPASGRDDGTSPDVGDGLATWRVMNSPHVWNTYFSMYKIAQQYPALTERPAAEYLDMSYRTMKAYFEHDDARLFLPDSSRDMGSMGELSIPLIEDALRTAGRAGDADIIRDHARHKYEFLSAKKYPFASEMSIDTTAFETNYTLAKKFDDRALVRKVTLASLASRGNQPLWYFYGSDNRHMGESWWNLGYETQLGAWQQLDYAKNFDPAEDGVDSDELMRSTYGAYLAGWANINSGQISGDPGNYGAASWIYNSEHGASDYKFIPRFGGWWAWSGESALGFWGGVQTASVNVVNDKIVGVYGYGGDVAVSDSGYTVTPKDGVRQRLNLFTENKLGIELTAATYNEATVAKGATSITLKLDKSTVSAAKPSVKVANLPAGEYQISVNGQTLRSATTAELATGIALPASAAERQVQIAMKSADTTAPVSSVVTNPVSGSAVSGSTVTATFSATDEGSGVAYTEYSLDKGVSWLRATDAGVTFKEVGSYELRYRSADTAGNVETARSVSVSITASPVKVEATASTQKVGGKVYVLVTATNTSTVPVQIDVVTAYGKKTFTGVQPGAKVSVSMNSTRTSVPAGKATVTAIATIDGKRLTASVDAPYAART